MSNGTATHEPAPSLPRPAAATQTTKTLRTKFATCNLRNLALPGIHFYPDDKPYSQQEFEKKRDWIAEQLTKLDADFVGFQEVFHKEALEQAVARSKLGANARVIVEDRDVATLRPRVALATTLPVIGEPRIIADIPEDALLHFPDGDKPVALVPVTKFSRPVLRVEIGLWKGATDPTAEKAIVYVVHLKSMTPEKLVAADDLDDPMVYARAETRAQIRRTVEAAGIRSLVRSEVEGTTTPVIVMGDCNAGNPSVVAQIMCGPSPWRFDPLDKKRKLWDRMMYDAVDLQSKQSMNGTYYTHIYDGEYESLDHILLSEEFYELNARRVAKVEYVRLFTDHLVDGTLCSDDIPRWMSDHGWVVVTVRRENPSGKEVLARIDSVPIPE